MPWVLYDIQIKAIPPTIDHFGFYYAFDGFRDVVCSPLNSVVSLVESHSNLRVVSCWKKDQEYANFPALLNACLAKNVELNLLNSYVSPPWN